MKKLILSYFIVAIFLSCSSTQQQNVIENKTLHYTSLKDFADSGNILPLHSGVISEQPAKLKIAVEQVGGDNETVIKSLQQKEIIWTVYSVYSLTDIDTLTVIAAPYNKGISDESKSVSLTTNRKEALKVLKFIAKTDDLKALWNADGLTPSPVFDSIKSVDVAGNTFADFQLAKENIF